MEKNYVVAGTRGLLSKSKNTTGKSMRRKRSIRRFTAFVALEFLRGEHWDTISRKFSNDIGMSRQMVDHYMRFRDQMEVGNAGQARLKLVSE
jgi:hypothetical protein